MNTQKLRYSVLNNAYLSNLDWSLVDNKVSSAWRSFRSYIARTCDPVYKTWENPDPSLLNMRTQNSDTPNWFQAMNGPYSREFTEALDVEHETLKSIAAWDKVRRTPDMNVLKSTWAFKVKRFPSGLIKSFKARFCVRGDMQIEGVDFHETYAPVANWTTIRTLLVLSVQLGLCTAQLDYLAAFPQANLKEEVYVEMPRGYKEPGYVYKLKKSLYGLRQSPKNFFDHISEQLQSLGFTPSDSDQCLFIRDDCVCVTYVDDILVFDRSQDIINKLLKDLKDTGASVKLESDVAGYLGVDIRTLDDGRIEMKQTGLIDRVIVALGLERANAKETPANLGTLPLDAQGDNCNGDFSYASVLGMLLYLQGHTRPDIAFAVNQCARYAFSPKHSHEEALKRIGRYLLGTRDKGIYMLPNKTLQIDCYVDADFAGLWGYEEKDDPTCVRSRSGYLFMIGGCPIYWRSKLQNEISVSTMESEYVALSTSMRDLIPLQRVLEDICTGLDLDKDLSSTIKSNIWEDNEGALILAKMVPPRVTPRSKHFAIKYHWFREFVQDPMSKISLHKIDTKVQLADILTKSLSRVQFQAIRKLLMGW